MPIYDYQCTSCGFKKEVMRKVSEPSVTACPECTKETFAKQLSAPAFQLSGTGWYATDFKTGSAKPEAKTETMPETKTKTEIKTETKTEAAPAA